MEKTYELKPCPFCGEPGELREFLRPYRHGWIGCQVCGFYKNWQVNPRQAVEIWNSRKRPKRTVEP